MTTAQALRIKIGDRLTVKGAPMAPIEVVCFYFRSAAGDEYTDDDEHRYLAAGDHVIVNEAAIALGETTDGYIDAPVSDVEVVS